MFGKLKFEGVTFDNRYGTFTKEFTWEDIISIVLFFLHTDRFSVKFDDDLTYVRSCIGCNSKEAQFHCECHTKEYCSQECANKDHSF